jgi:hypothetical protein
MMSWLSTTLTEEISREQNGSGASIEDIAGWHSCSWSRAKAGNSPQADLGGGNVGLTSITTLEDVSSCGGEKVTAAGLAVITGS